MKTIKISEAAYNYLKNKAKAEDRSIVKTLDRILKVKEKP